MADCAREHWGHVHPVWCGSVVTCRTGAIPDPIAPGEEERTNDIEKDTCLPKRATKDHSNLFMVVGAELVPVCAPDLPRRRRQNSLA